MYTLKKRGLRPLIIIALAMLILFLGLDPTNASGKFYFTIHIQSFRSPIEAENLIIQLTKKGYDSFFRKTNVQGKGLWYRIFIGHFEEREKAMTYIQKLKTDEISDFCRLTGIVNNID